MDRQFSVSSPKLCNLSAKLKKLNKKGNQHKIPNNSLPLFMYTSQKVNKRNEQLHGHICPSVYLAVPCHCSALTLHQPDEKRSGKHRLFQLPTLSLPVVLPYLKAWHWFLLTLGFASWRIRIVYIRFQLRFLDPAWRLPKTGQVSLCWLHVCITFTLYCRLMFSKVMKLTKFSYHEVSQAIWLASVQPHYSGTLCK